MLGSVLYTVQIHALVLMVHFIKKILWKIRGEIVKSHVQANGFLLCLWAVSYYLLSTLHSRVQIPVRTILIGPQIYSTSVFCFPFSHIIYSLCPSKFTVLEQILELVLASGCIKAWAERTVNCVWLQPLFKAKLYIKAVILV